MEPANDAVISVDETGDIALREFADRLRASVRQTDLIGRLGGDEFVVLTEGVRNEDQARCI